MATLLSGILLILVFSVSQSNKILKEEAPHYQTSQSSVKALKSLANDLLTLLNPVLIYQFSNYSIIHRY